MLLCRDDLLIVCSYMYLGDGSRNQRSTVMFVVLFEVICIPPQRFECIYKEFNNISFFRIQGEG